MNNNMDVSASQSSRHFNNTALDKSLAKEKVKIDVKNRFHKPCTLSIAKEKSDVLTLESKIFRGKVSPKPKLNVKKSENDSDNLSTSSDSSSHKKQKIKIQPSDLLTDPDKSAEEGEPSSDSIIESSSESRVESPKSSTNETKMSNDKFEARQEFEKSKLNDRLKKLSDQQSQISHSIKKRYTTHGILLKFIEKIDENSKLKDQAVYTILDNVIKFCDENIKTNISPDEKQMLSDIRTKAGELIVNSQFKPLNQIDSHIKHEKIKESIKKICSQMAEFNLAHIQTLHNKNELILNSINELKNQLKIPHDDEKAHSAVHMNSQMREVYLKKFTSYVANELNRQDASEIVESLITVGKGLGILKETTVDKDGNVIKYEESGSSKKIIKPKLKKDQTELMNHIHNFERKKHKKVPLVYPSNELDNQIIKAKVPIFLPNQPKSPQEECRVFISKNSATVKWIARIENKNQNEIKEFPDYTQAAAWVHSRLDYHYYEKSGLKRNVIDLLKSLQVGTRIIEAFEQMGESIEPPVIHASFVAPGTESFESIIENISNLGLSCDVASLLLIIPSIFLAIEAHELKEKNDLTLDSIKSRKNEIMNNTQSINKILSQYSNIKTEIDNCQTHNEVINTLEAQKEIHLSQFKTRDLQQNLGDNPNYKKNKNDFDTLIHLANDNLKKEKEIKALKAAYSEDKKDEIDKAAATTTNIIGVVSYATKTIIAFKMLATHGSLELTKEAIGQTLSGVCAGLSIIGASCFMVAGGVQISTDSARIHKSRKKMKKSGKTFDKLLTNNELSQDDKTLVSELKKIHSRKERNKIKSGSIAVGADIGMIGVGSGSLALGIALATGTTVSCPPLVVLPILAGLGFAAKISSDAVVERHTRKKQKKLIAEDPAHSDIGIIYRLGKRIQQNDEGAKLIVEEIIIGYFGFPSKEDFLSLIGVGTTEDHLEKRYNEIEAVAKNTSSLTKMML